MSTLTSPSVPLSWWRDAPPDARRALVAASLGWALDAFDVMLYAVVLASLMRDFDMTAGLAGRLGALTLLASAAGGVLFGFVADRYGRTRALMASILLCSIFTAACGLAQTIWQLAVFRVLLGFGMGGEWASGAALVSETWPAAHRGKALGLMQSAWAVGYAGAALVAGALLPRVGWRAVFFVGVLPALLTVWVRRHVREPDLWLNRAAAGAGAPVTFGELLHGPLLRVTVALTLMNACTMFGWWGLNLWVAGYLSLPAGQGGMGFSPERMALFVFVMQGGMWLGYVSYGFVADEIGRKRTYVAYLLAAAVLLPAYGLVREPWMLLALGPVVAFFGTGYFAGFGAVTAELYPTAIRGRAQGFTYNIGRVASAAAPAVVGSLAQARGFALAFTVAGSAFLLAALLWIWIPETRGRTLE